MEQCGFSILGATGNVAPRKKLKRIPNDFDKSISEAIVYVPFTRTKIPNVTTSYSINGKYFFSIDLDVWSVTRNNIHKNKPYAIEHNDLGSNMNIKKTSISNMIETMQKYILPPRFDFIKYPNNIPPFVMYMFEFEHKFTQQELIDI